MSDKEYLGFLLGSGISLKAGLPACSEMTTEILTGEKISWSESGAKKIERIYRCNGDKYQIGKPDNEPSLQPVDRRILLFLQILKAEADTYLYGQTPANYEDLFYMVYEILGSKTGQLRHPAIHPLMQQIDQKFDKLYGDYQAMTRHEEDYGAWEARSNRLRINNLTKLANEAYLYIRGYVYSRLSENHPNENYFKANPNGRCFKWISCAAQDIHFSHKFFFTLNNDVLLEMLFRSEGITFNDGFSEPCMEGHDRNWKYGAFEKESAVVIAKLHGSINWFFGSSTFAEDDIKDLSGLIERLRRQTDPVSAFLWNKLSNSEQSLLTSYRPTTQDSILAQIVVQALNKIILQPCILEDELFKGIPLRPETAILFQQRPKGLDLAYLNRLLLEEAYPLELSRNHAGIVSCHPTGPLEKSQRRGPIILVGADNKGVDYNKPVFDELHFQFYTALKKVKRLIVCGYGFGDNVINLRLRSWLNRSLENKIVLIHRNPAECLRACHPTFEAQLNARKQLISIPNFMGDDKDPITWKKVLESLRA